MASTYFFPQYKDFSDVLNIGHVGSSFKIEKDLDKKRVLIILDVTGSMDEMFNDKTEYHSFRTTKYQIAINILKNLVKEFLTYDLKFDILPFNEKPLPLMTYDNTESFWDTLPKPDNCTYFTPLVDEINKLLESLNNYAAVFFASDGIPSEDKHDALEAVTKIGIKLRSKDINTGSLAIGVDADGFACAKFAGERGINIFINKTEMITQVINDMKIVIKNQYIKIGEKSIPVEEDGKYYYIQKSKTHDPIDLTNEITLNVTKKFIDLLIIYESTQPYFNQKLIGEIKIYINKIAEILPKDDKVKFLDFYKNILKEIETTQLSFGASNCLASAVSQNYRILSQQY
jgi:hypothetical protein